MSKRIDSLVIGNVVMLDFNDGNVPHEAMFLGIEGSGNERRATFASFNEDETLYQWDAYRFKGRWAITAPARIV